MIVKVVLFALARDLTGSSEVNIEVDEAATVGTLRGELARRFPQLADLVSRSAIAVDHEFAVDDQLIGSESDVALIPPVSGG